MSDEETIAELQQQLGDTQVLLDEERTHYAAVEHKLKTLCKAVEHASTPIGDGGAWGGFESDRQVLRAALAAARKS